MGTGLFMVLTLVAYFVLLLAVSRHKGGRGRNDDFFRAGRESSWWMVAFGMIGASISGVSFISVPGWVASTGMSYLQMCMGFVAGYAAVAFVLLPLYYRLRLTSIYAYAGERFGPVSHRTSALFFLLSKLTGAAARLYLVCLVIQQFVAAPLGCPFPLTVLAVLLLIWGYTHRSGMRTLVRTDALQTLCMLVALAGVVVIAVRQLGLSWEGLAALVRESPYGYVFVWDAQSPQAFWRQFLSGAFIVVVMTGLDQDMMQKNLSCKSLKDAQKNMYTYGLAFTPVNFLFLTLGVLLLIVAEREQITLPVLSDDILPMFCTSGILGSSILIFFTVGIIAAAFSSADSALTALTTTFCVDILNVQEEDARKAKRMRLGVHLLMSVLFALIILVIKEVNNRSVIDAIYMIASYTYGPLLGLFVFGLFTKRLANDRIVPYLCIASPVICFLTDYAAKQMFGYTFGYEMLMFNGAITFAGLWFSSPKSLIIKK